jgi:hypothetical protein
LNFYTNTKIDGAEIDIFMPPLLTMPCKWRKSGISFKPRLNRPEKAPAFLNLKMCFQIKIKKLPPCGLTASSFCFILFASGKDALRREIFEGVFFSSLLSLVNGNIKREGEVWIFWQMASTWAGP